MEFDLPINNVPFGLEEINNENTGNERKSLEDIKLTDQEEELLFLKCSNRVKAICYTAQSISARLSTSSMRLETFLVKLLCEIILQSKRNPKGNVPSLANWFDLLGSHLLYWEIQHIPTKSIRIFKKEFENCLSFIENYLFQCDKLTSKLQKLEEKIENFSYYLSKYKEFYEKTTLQKQSNIRKLAKSEERQALKDSTPMSNLITLKFSSVGNLSICQNEKEIKITEASSLIQVEFVTICIDHIHRALNPLFCAMFSEEHSALQELISDLETLKLNLKTQQKFNAEFNTFTSHEKFFLSNSFISIEAEIGNFAKIVDKLKVEFDKFLAFVEIIKLSFCHRKLYTNEELTLSGLIKDRESILRTLTAFTTEFNLADEDPITLKLLNDLINRKESPIGSLRKKNFYTENILNNINSISAETIINTENRNIEEIEIIKASTSAIFNSIKSTSDLELGNPNQNVTMKSELETMINSTIMLNKEDPLAYATTIEIQMDKIQKAIEKNLVEVLYVLRVPSKRLSLQGSLTCIEEMCLVIAAASREFKSYIFLQKREFGKLGEIFSSLLSAIQLLEKAKKKYQKLLYSQLFNVVEKKKKSYEKEIIQLYGFSKTWDYDLKYVEVNHIRNAIKSRVNESLDSARTLKKGEIEIGWENSFLQFKANDDENEREEIFSFLDLTASSQWSLILTLVKKLEMSIKKATRIMKDSVKEIEIGKSHLKNLFDFVSNLDKRGIIRPEEKREACNILMAKILSSAEGLKLFECTLKPIRVLLNDVVKFIMASNFKKTREFGNKNLRNHDNPKLSQEEVKSFEHIHLLIEFSTDLSPKKTMEEIPILKDFVFYLQKLEKSIVNSSLNKIGQQQRNESDEPLESLQNFPSPSHSLVDEVSENVNLDSSLFKQFTDTIIPSLEILIQRFPKRAYENLGNPSPTDNLFFLSNCSRLQALLFVLGIAIEKIKFYEIKSQNTRENIFKHFENLQQNAKILQKQITETENKLQRIALAINSFLGDLRIKGFKKDQMPEHLSHTLIVPIQEDPFHHVPFCTLQYSPSDFSTRVCNLVIKSVEIQGRVGPIKNLHFDQLDIIEQIVIVKQILKACRDALMGSQACLNNYQCSFENLKRSLMIWAKSIREFKKGANLTEDEVGQLKEAMATLNAAREKTREYLKMMMKIIQGFLNIYFLEWNNWKPQINIQDWNLASALRQDTVRRYIMYEQTVVNASFKNLVSESLVVKIPFPITRRH